MSSNVIGPSGFSNPELNEAIRDAVMTGNIRPITEVVDIPPRHLETPWDDVKAIAKELQAGRAPAIGQRQQKDNSPQVRSRSPDEPEKEALKFTFGYTMGDHLIRRIEIGQAGVATAGKIRMVLPSGYDPNNLDSLATFIYEATRIWQKEVGQFLKDGDEDEDDYNYEDLYKLELTSTQHAEAVKHWFYVNYGIETGEVSFQKDQIKFEGLWKETLTVLGLTRWQRVKFGKKNLGGQEGTLQQTVNNHYGCVIKEIRDTKPIQVLVPTANTQITTFGGIKAGGKTV